jgi:hypothetical protein
LPFGGLKAGPGPFLNIYTGLTREIISWLCDSKRKSTVYLIAELLRRKYNIEIPTRGSILAGICHDADRLEDNIGFDLNDLIGELAACYPPYRHVLTGLLIDNPGILALPTRTRFKKLINEPWKALQESHPQYITTPPVIVLHWHSDDDEELLYSILEFNSSRHPSPLLWIISIDRSEKLPIRDLLDPFASFRYIRLPVCYDDGPSDAALILHHKFDTIRRKYKEMLNPGRKWPSDEQMLRLSRIVSGVLESIDVIVNFVDLKDGGGPEAHLETFLACMVDSPSPSDERPYCALDHFYTHAFSKTPTHLLSVMNQILSIIYYSIHRNPVSPLQIACLLSIGKDTVLNAHAYLSGWAVTRTEQWYRPASELFRGFLKDSERPGQFCLNSKWDLTILEVFLHFLSYSSNLLELLKSRVQSIPVNPNTYSELDDLRHSVSQMFYALSTVSRQAFLEHMLTLRFDFRCLAHTSDKLIAAAFMSFLCELHKVSALIE